jgi:glycosyltransferase involved in cell wall biosynthesis
MPFIVCKENVNSSSQGMSAKGIVVFKHLEIKFFNALPAKIREAIKSRYNIIYYFGFHAEFDEDLMGADGYISDHNVLRISNSNIPRLFLNGFNFIGDEFCDNVSLELVRKEFDFIYVGDPQKRKNLDLLIAAIKNVHELNYFPKIIIVNRVNSNSRDISKRNEFLKKYLLSNIDKTHKNNIVYIESDGGFGFLLPSYFIKCLMEKCRALIIPSSEEGAARVVAEAKVLGLDVISNLNMKGGSNNYLDEDDLLFEGEVDLTNKIISYLKRSDIKRSEQLKSDRYKKIFCEKFTRKEAIDWFSKTYGVDRQYIETSLLNKTLYNSFSSHNVYIPRDVPSNKSTDECLTNISMLKFSTYLLDSFSAGISNVAMAFIFDCGLIIKKFLRGAINSVVNFQPRIKFRFSNKWWR